MLVKGQYYTLEITKTLESMVAEIRGAICDALLWKHVMSESPDVATKEYLKEK